MVCAVTISHQPRAKHVLCTDDSLEVLLHDGRKINAPLTWFPRLLAASPEDRAKWELSGAGQGIHWPKIDEDLSVGGLLAGSTHQADNGVFDHSTRTRGFFQEGAALSTMWIAIFFAMWVTNFFGFLTIGAADLGSLLSGFFAPLALIWFIVALRHQAAELAQNTDALRLQAHELRDSVEQLRAQAGVMVVSEKNQRLDVSLQFYSTALNRLADLCAGILYNLSEVYRTTGAAQQVAQREITQKLDGLWGRYASGDKDVFFGVLRGDISRAGYVSVDHMIDDAKVRRHLTGLLLTFVATRSEIEKQLRDREAPKFMVNHIAEGSPARVARRLQSILKSEPYKSTSSPTGS